MDRYTRKRMIFLAIFAIIAYVGVYHVILPRKLELLRKVCTDEVMADSRVEMQGTSNTTSKPSDGKDHYTITYDNKGSKDKVYELMMGGGGE